MNCLKYHKTVGFKENSADTEVNYSFDPPEREKKGSMTISLDEEHTSNLRASQAISEDRTTGNRADV